MEHLTVLLTHNDPQFLQKIKKETALLKCDIQKEIKTGIKALRFILREQPDIAVLDTNFEDISVFEIVKEIKNKKIRTKCVLLFNDEDRNNMLIASSLQVDACVYTKHSLVDLVPAIKAAHRGVLFVSNELKEIKLIDASLEKLEELTQTEITILALIGIYKTSTKISEKLMTSVRTVEKHRSNIIKKLQLKKESFSLSYWAVKHQDIIHSFALQRVS